jgi:hypothetical protein
MSVVRKQLYYLWKKAAERNARKKLAAGYFKSDIERYEKSTERKPAGQIKQELTALQRYWRCYPFQYFRFDMYRSDCLLSLEEMKKHVPLFFLDALFYPVNQNGYGILTADKLLNYALLKAYDVPQPTMLLCFDHQRFFDSANNRISETAAEAILQSSQAYKLFVKPRLGSGGKGIFVFKKQGMHYANEQHGLLNQHFFRNHLKEALYLVQEGLVQHEAMNRIYPHSINTFRVITECAGSEARVLYALLRTGRGGNQVDNASSGGLYVKVDPETGALSPFAYAYNRLTVDAHPDTGFVFKDAMIEDWAVLKTFATQVAEKFREIRFLGWDIAFTAAGPAVVELNNSPDMGMIQDFYGGVRDSLHINPTDWWYQSKFTIKTQ